MGLGVGFLGVLGLLVVIGGSLSWWYDEPILMSVGLWGAWVREEVHAPVDASVACLVRVSGGWPDVCSVLTHSACMQGLAG